MNSERAGSTLVMGQMVPRTSATLSFTPWSVLAESPTGTDTETVRWTTA